MGRLSKRSLHLKKISQLSVKSRQEVIKNKNKEINNANELYHQHCEMCGNEVFQEVTKKAYTPLVDCPTEKCKKNRIRGRLLMQTKSCKFLPFQEVKMQEMTEQVPVGHIPRTMTILLYGEVTRSMNPGDVVNVSGIFQATPHKGYKGSTSLLTDVYLEGQYVNQLKKQYDKMEKTPEVEEKLMGLRGDPLIYEKLSSSIAPEIYGHGDVKKALLLLLIGGVTKNTSDGMKIRGDLNICLMGDPGVAKSQLLKYICKVAPRGVYTTGRGSSGVGLTASINRDPTTDEMILGGGSSHSHHNNRQQGDGSDNSSGIYDENFFPSPTHPHHNKGGWHHKQRQGDKLVDQEFFNDFPDDFDDEDLN
ncbi:15836_t:CDS:2 [Entrophospora sp. SA101]|nr:15836_t:CDS:2 [Entrophospora sp. SA101]CAJ0847935.1 6741_t:CDS:2 [Entrophospora sp. SA101]